MFRAMLGEAWHAMGANRLRTFLTMLGMVIGVGAVVLMMAVGQGAEAKIKESIESLGSNLFIVLSGAPMSSGVRAGGGSAATLSLEDAMAIEELENVTNVAPVNRAAAQLIFAGKNWSTNILGTSSAYFEINKWIFTDGFEFSESDNRLGKRVAVIGSTVAANLFDDVNPIGKTLRINNSPFTVIGVLRAKGQSMDGRDQDDTVIIPIISAQRHLLGGGLSGRLRMIMVQADTAENMPIVESEINALLRQRHRLRDNAPSDFFINNLTATLDTAVETTRTMGLLLGAIASVSLLVGGIGIMNIMLVSVTERTREIGIRMAIGARERDILMQFLLEAIMISVVGCLIGLCMGIGGAILVNQLSDAMIVISSQAVATAFAVAATVGIFFGFYPARKAAQLNPIEALRYQ